MQINKKWQTILGCLLLCICNSVIADKGNSAIPKGPLASEFPEALEWLNTGGRSLSIEQLKGRIVLLDFWTYGCVNCLHIIPALKQIEKKYADDLVVIGVHSAKFAQEGKTSNIRNLVMQYGIEHPVVNDHDFAIWNRYRARAWPTLVLINPDGRMVGRWLGENEMSAIDEHIGLLQSNITKVQRDQRSPLNLVLETSEQPDDGLKFPAKVLVDGKNRRLFITDTGHNRIIITDLNGVVEDVIGGRQSGLEDGSYAQARFSFPRGLALTEDNQLYVADTENHLIRRIDLEQKQVVTVAGTGQQTFQLQKEGVATQTGINSPWDVLWHGKTLYIAMAGQHQIWSYDPANNHLQAFAGSGREELRDGPRLQAGLNQPSALARDDNYLYIADSEASAIRRVPLLNRYQQGEQILETLVGTGLFDFGDVDGIDRQVRLQHPLGVAMWRRGLNDPDQIVIADTYNDKIKLLNPVTREVTSIENGIYGLDEPSGISVLGNLAYLADTNHHVIRIVNLHKQSFKVLELQDSQSRL